VGILALAILTSLVLVCSVSYPVQADTGDDTVDLTAEVVTYQITDLSTSNPTQNSIGLTWTTPEAGTHAFSYFDLRYSKVAITSDNWDEATRVGGELTPVAGASQGMKVRGLGSSTTYYFAIKLVDEEGIVGLLSNIASATTTVIVEEYEPVPSAPVPPIELAATSPDSMATDTEGNELTVTPGFMTITEEEETVTVSIPVALEEGATMASFTDPSGVTFADNRLVIPAASMAVDGQPWFRIVDEERDLQATLIIETGDAVGTGTAAVAEVKSINADAEFTTKDFTPEDPSLGEVASTVTIDLNTLPVDAEVKIVASLEPEPEAGSAFQLAATAAGMESVDIAYVINVTKTNLENGTDIQSATIIMKAGAEWVETHGGVDVIRIIRYDPEAGEQQVLETHFRGYDEQGRAIFEGISPNGLSVFGLAGIAPKAAEFVISELVVTPEEVRVGETVTITADVTNTGEVEGSCNVVLKINGVVEATTEVTLDSSAKQEVSFSIARDIAATYSVDVNGLKTSFTVKEKLVPVVPVIPKPINWSLIGGIIGGVIAVGLLVYFLAVRRRRAQGKTVN